MAGGQITLRPRECGQPVFRPDGDSHTVISGLRIEGKTRKGEALIAKSAEQRFRRYFGARAAFGSRSIRLAQHSARAAFGTRAAFGSRSIRHPRSIRPPRVKPPNS